MGDQTSQRQNLMSQAADACRDYLLALHKLNTLKDRAAFVGAAVDSDFVGTDLAHLDAAVCVELFQHVIPSLVANYTDAGANAGRNRRVLNQVAPTI